MTRRIVGAVLAGLICGLGGAAHAEVSLPALFGDNMVLQQKAPVRVFGKATPGEKVTVELDKKQAQTVADAEGRWIAVLPAKNAGGPYTLTVRGTNTLEIKNVLFGEVWLCSGQSNMEWSLRNSFQPEAAIANSANPQIRFFNVKNVRSDVPKDNVEATWQTCGPESAAGFSAVGYYFGRDLAKSRNVPIGLVAVDWGGTPAEAWTPEDALKAEPVLSGTFSEYERSRVAHEKSLADYPAQVEAAKVAGKEAPRRPNAPWKPAELYNGMVAPLAPFSVKGAIWYQGESNAGRATQYRTLLSTLIQSWRAKFQNPDLAFFVVQLAPYSSGNSQNTNYAELREAQDAVTQTLPQTGLAVITDVGEENDIHPKRKEPVGVRLALLARRIAYGEKVNALSPRFRDISAATSALSNANLLGRGNGAIAVRFSNVGDGLIAKGGEISGKSVAENVVAGFEVAGNDGVFKPAEGRIVGKDTVVVASPDVGQPTLVRYGFRNFAVCNLFSKDGLPAVPFRSDAPTSVAVGR